MATPRKLAGKIGRVIVSSAIVAVIKFNMTMKAEKQDVTGSESGGSFEYADGLHGWSGSFDANYDAAQNPHADPPDINEGDIVPAQFMVENTAGANGTYSGNIYIDNIKVDLAVAGKVTYSVDFTGNLAITKPTANIDS